MRRRMTALVLAAVLVLTVLSFPSPSRAEYHTEVPAGATLITGGILDKATVSFHPQGIQSSLSVKGNGGGAGQNVVHLYNLGDAFRFWLTKADNDSYYIDFFGGADDYDPSNKRLDLSDSGSYYDAGNVVHVVWGDKEADNKKWQFYRNPDGTYYIRNKKSGLYWGLEMVGYNDENKLVQHYLDSTPCKRWEMEVVAADGSRSIQELKEYDSYSFMLNSRMVTGTNWMSFLPDDMVLSDVTIPGTHDSATAQLNSMMNASAQCQQLSIKDQLNNGIRYFDLRVGMEYWSDETLWDLIMIHGVLDLSCYYKGDVLSLYKVMDWIRDFLQKNPTETVIIQPMADAFKLFLSGMVYDFFKDLKDKYPNLFYIGDHVPTMEECRGKIVIISRLKKENKDYRVGDGNKQWALDAHDWKAWTGISENPLELTATGSNYQIWTQDKHTRIDGDKWLIVEHSVFNASTGAAALRAKVKATNRDAWIISYTSCVDAGKPKKYPQWTARYINPRLVEKLQTDPSVLAGQYLGVVCSDFTDQQLAYLVYKQNFIRGYREFKVRGFTADGKEPIDAFTTSVDTSQPLSETLDLEEIESHFSADPKYKPYGYADAYYGIPLLSVWPMHLIEDAADYLTKTVPASYTGADATELYVALDKAVNPDTSQATTIRLDLDPPECGSWIALDGEWYTQTPAPSIGLSAGEPQYNVKIAMRDDRKRVYWCDKDGNPIGGTLAFGSPLYCHIDLEAGWGAFFKNGPLELAVEMGNNPAVSQICNPTDKKHVSARAINLQGVKHTLKRVAAKSAGCTEGGWIEHYICSGCGQRFADANGTEPRTEQQVLIAAEGHNWMDWSTVKPATETEPGEQIRYCRVSYDHFETRVIPAAGHVHQLSYVKPVAASCTEQGSKGYYVCNGGDHPCGRYFSDAQGTEEIDSSAAILPALGHVWQDPEYVWAEDYSSLTASRTCARDHSHIQMEIRTDPAVYRDREAGCVEDGIVRYVAAFAQDSPFTAQTAQVILPALGHVRGEGTIDAHSTCEIPGRMSVYCERCNAGLDSVALPLVDHNWGEPIYTWAADNSTVTATHICGYNNEHTETETVAAHRAEVAATCESDGVSMWYSDDFKNLDFTLQEKDKVITPALGHDWSEWTITQRATEAANGLETRTCQRQGCGKQETRVIPASNHVHSMTHTPAVAATCEESGNIEYWVCDQGENACGKTFSDADGRTAIDPEKTVIPALGHDWGDWAPYAEANCSSPKHEVRTCGNDSTHKEFRAIGEADPNAHLWGDWTAVKKATVRTPGEEVRICSVDETHQETRPISKAAPEQKPEQPYTGAPLELVTAASVQNGTMLYALGTEEGPFKEYTSDIPTATDAGTWVVWYKFEDNERYSSDEPNYLFAHIAKVSAEVILEPVPLTLTYTGQPQLLVTPGTAKGGEMQYALRTNTGFHDESDFFASIPEATDIGTYYVYYRVKGDANHTNTQPYSNVKVVITDKPTISAAVTFKVANGSWDDGTTADKVVTLTGFEGDTLKLSADQIPAVGSKPNDTYTAGSWDVTPSVETAITQNTTYIYTYAMKDAATVTIPPAPRTQTYTGQALALVTAGTAEGGEMRYAAGTAEGPAGPYSTAIPAATEAGTYYVWYMAVGDADHNDSAPAYVTPVILKAASNVTTPPVAGKLAFNGQAQALVTAGTAAGGTIQYAVGSSAATAPDSGWSADIPSKTDAGTYYVWYRVVGDANHLDYNAPQPIEAVIEADGEQEEKIEVKPLDRVPAELEPLYDTVEEIRYAMMMKVSINGKPVRKGNTALYDVILSVSADGGRTWQPATEENYPLEGVRVTLPYPEGTNGADYDFAVSHMFTVTSKRLGTVAGGIEVPAFTETESGLDMVLRGLSPVLVSWEEPGEKPTPTPTPRPIPKTGDQSRPGIWTLLILLGAAAVLAVCLAERKRRKQG